MISGVILAAGAACRVTGAQAANRSRTVIKLRNTNRYRFIITPLCTEKVVH